MWPFGKREDSKKFKRMQAEKFANLIIESVTERLENNEEILVGKAGSTSMRQDRFIVCSEGKVVFEGDIYEISIAELMSRNGVIITGWDYETESERCVVAHFSYYRKLSSEG